jgi:hypothetical protein
MTNEVVKGISNEHITSCGQLKEGPQQNMQRFW